MTKPQTSRLILAAALALPVAACTAPPESAEREIHAPAATVAGAPVSCISTNRIRDTKVHDDYTIDFEMVDGTVYRQSLRYRCASLGFEERFAYQTTIGQLCSTDTITVLQSGGGVPGPTCALEAFVPVTLAKTGG